MMIHVWTINLIIQPSQRIRKYYYETFGSSIIYKQPNVPSLPVKIIDQMEEKQTDI